MTVHTNSAIEKDIITKDWKENAVLIYGPRKSGTTLLQNLLDGGNYLLMRQAEILIKLYDCGSSIFSQGKSFLSSETLK